MTTRNPMASQMATDQDASLVGQVRTRVGNDGFGDILMSLEELELADYGHFIRDRVLNVLNNFEKIEKYVEEALYQGLDTRKIFEILSWRKAQGSPNGLVTPLVIEAVKDDIAYICSACTLRGVNISKLRQSSNESFVRRFNEICLTYKILRGTPKTLTDVTLARMCATDPISCARSLCRSAKASNVRRSHYIHFTGGAALIRSDEREMFADWCVWACEFDVLINPRKRTDPERVRRYGMAAWSSSVITDDERSEARESLTILWRQQMGREPTPFCESFPDSKFLHWFETFLGDTMDPQYSRKRRRGGRYGSPAARNGKDDSNDSDDESNGGSEYGGTKREFDSRGERSRPSGGGGNRRNPPRQARHPGGHGAVKSFGMKGPVFRIDTGSNSAQSLQEEGDQAGIVEPPPVEVLAEMSENEVRERFKPKELPVSLGRVSAQPPPSLSYEDNDQSKSGKIYQQKKSSTAIQRAKNRRQGKAARELSRPMAGQGRGIAKERLQRKLTGVEEAMSSEAEEDTGEIIATTHKRTTTVSRGRKSAVKEISSDEEEVAGEDVPEEAEERREGNLTEDSSPLLRAQTENTFVSTAREANLLTGNVGREMISPPPAVGRDTAILRAQETSTSLAEDNEPMSPSKGLMNALRSTTPIARELVIEGLSEMLVEAGKTEAELQSVTRGIRKDTYQANEVAIILEVNGLM